MGRRRIEAWYLSYALVGATAAGLTPILLPLIVGRQSSAAEIGAVMAALNLGGLAGPAAGDLADRLDARRPLFVSGCLMLAAALAAFRFFDGTVARLLLAFAQGTGTAVVATIASLLVVERHPRAEWDERIGWLQTFYGSGQVAGLGVAAAVGGRSLAAGLWIAAACSATAAIVLLIALPGAPRSQATHARVHAVRAPGASAVCSQGHTRAMLVEAITGLKDMRAAGFLLFLLAWFVTYGGAAGIFSLYPVLMARVFEVPPATSSLVYGAAAAVALVLYSPAGRWSQRIGASRVLRRGLAARVAAAAALWLAASSGGSAGAWVALGSFAVIVLAWSLLAVAGTVITAQSSGVGEGPAMGLFNATTSLAAVAGSLGAGALAAGPGYPSVTALATVSLIVGLLMVRKGVAR